MKSKFLLAVATMVVSAGQLLAAAASKVTGPTPALELPGKKWEIDGKRAFVFMPEKDKRSNPQPWVMYAPTLPGYPDGAERWMHESLLEAGIAVAGIDVGEAYGSRLSHLYFDALYRDLIEKEGFAKKPVLLGRSRGGLWVSSWAITNPGRVAGIIGIYPVFDFKTYPGIEKAAVGYELSADELTRRESEFNPIHRIGVLARARIPVVLIHGDVDKVVPLEPNSGRFVEEYKKAGAENLVRLIALKGQGHSFFEGFFHSQELVDAAIAHARAGAK